MILCVGRSFFSNPFHTWVNQIGKASGCLSRSSHNQQSHNDDPSESLHCSVFHQRTLFHRRLPYQTQHTKAGWRRAQLLALKRWGVLLRFLSWKRLYCSALLRYSGCEYCKEWWLCPSSVWCLYKRTDGNLQGSATWWFYVSLHVYDSMAILRFTRIRNDLFRNALWVSTCVRFTPDKTGNA